MANEILNSLLKDYEKKRLYAELELEERKKQLYLKLPRLKEIEDELNNYAINTAKNILNNNSSSLNNLTNKINSLKKEKETILKNNNLDLSYLQPFYSCMNCKDTGYVLDNNYKTIMCNCLKQKLLNISFNKSNIKKENFDNFNEDLFSTQIDLAKNKRNISPQSNIIYIKQKCEEFIENFDNPKYKNLLFTGNTGLR